MTWTKAGWRFGILAIAIARAFAVGRAVLGIAGSVFAVNVVLAVGVFVALVAVIASSG
jgi:hypothetical protein